MRPACVLRGTFAQTTRRFHYPKECSGWLKWQQSSNQLLNYTLRCLCACVCVLMSMQRYNVCLRMYGRVYLVRKWNGLQSQINPITSGENCARCCSKRIYFADEVIFNEHGFASLFPGENCEGMWYNKLCAVEEKQWYRVVMCSLERTNDSDAATTIVSLIPITATWEPLVPQEVGVGRGLIFVGRSRPESFGVVWCRLKSSGVVQSRLKLSGVDSDPTAIISQPTPADPGWLWTTLNDSERLWTTLDDSGRLWTTPEDFRRRNLLT